jgi:hypothetical protein
MTQSVAIENITTMLGSNLGGVGEYSHTATSLPSA